MRWLKAVESFSSQLHCTNLWGIRACFWTEFQIALCRVLQQNSKISQDENLAKGKQICQESTDKYRKMKPMLLYSTEFLSSPCIRLFWPKQTQQFDSLSLMESLHILWNYTLRQNGDFVVAHSKRKYEAKLLFLLNSREGNIINLKHKIQVRRELLLFTIRNYIKSPSFTYSLDSSLSFTVFTSK